MSGPVTLFRVVSIAHRNANSSDSPRAGVETGVVQGSLAGKYLTDTNANRNAEGKRPTSDWNQFIHAYKSGEFVLAIRAVSRLKGDLHCRPLGPKPYTTPATQRCRISTYNSSDITFSEIFTRAGAIPFVVEREQCQVESQSGNRGRIVRYRVVSHQYIAEATLDRVSNFRSHEGLSAGETPLGNSSIGATAFRARQRKIRNSNR